MYADNQSISCFRWSCRIPLSTWGYLTRQPRTSCSWCHLCWAEHGMAHTPVRRNRTLSTASSVRTSYSGTNWPQSCLGGSCPGTRSKSRLRSCRKWRRCKSRSHTKRKTIMVSMFYWYWCFSSSEAVSVKVSQQPADCHGHRPVSSHHCDVREIFSRTA